MPLGLTFPSMKIIAQNRKDIASVLELAAIKNY